MDELFTIIGKLYFDLYRSQSVIASLKEQLEALKDSGLNTNEQVINDRRQKN